MKLIDDINAFLMFECDTEIILYPNCEELFKQLITISKVKFDVACGKDMGDFGNKK